MTAVLPQLTTADPQLAAYFGLPLDPSPPLDGFYLHAHVCGLTLQRVGHEGQLRLDFVGGKLGYRRLHGGSEAIVRAVGLKPSQPLSVIDATAGLGRDAFILAAHGARVTLVERHPALAALLADALQRALMDEATTAIASRMQLHYGAALATLTGWLGEPPAVVYLDPMFPHRRKSALVKQEMQWLQQLVGADDDADALLLPARQLACQRVVVKRPEQAPPLAGVKPSGAVASRGHRFDIYAPVS
ncbi:MAG: class I SAM-dependent methyltransferase [Gammaproteobacteria bacterium]|nr:class I SAM-dependent methyltransferase [Gammaproteobacteria bacterium]